MYVETSVKSKKKNNLVKMKDPTLNVSYEGTNY